MKNFTKWAVFSVMLLLSLQVLAQSDQTVSRSNLSKVFEKITTNPATGYEDNDLKIGNPNDGGANVYLSEIYKSKVKSVTYQTRNIDEKYRYRTKVAVEANMIYIKGLRQNVFEIIEVELKNGNILKDEKNGVVFNVLTASYHQLPVGKNLENYTINMEGSNVAIFKDHYQKFQQKLIEMRSINPNIGLGDVTNSFDKKTANSSISSTLSVSPSVGGEPCNSATDWYMDPNYNNGQVIGGLYVYRFYNLCGCYILFRCIDHNATVMDASAAQGWYQRVSGTVSNNDLVLTPVNGNGQRVKTCGYCDGGQHCDGYVPPQCTNPVITIIGSKACAGSSVVLTASGATTYLWSTGSKASSIVVTAGGTYTVTGYNGNCSSKANFTVTFIALPVIAATVTPPNCTTSTGTITITAVTGATYSFDNGATFQASNVKSGLAANTNYNLLVKNSSGCNSAVLVKNTGAVVIAPVSPAATVTPPTCTTSTATITITAVTGATYSFDNGATFQASNIKSALTANTNYYLLVKNSSGCNSAALVKNTGAVVPVSPTPAITLVTNGPVCLNTQVVFNVAVTNGTASNSYSYKYEYSKDNGATYTQWSTTTAGSSQPGGSYVPNAPGLWKFRVTVSNSCGSNSAETPAIVVKEALPVPVITLNSTTACNGAFVYFNDGVSNAVAGEQYDYKFYWSNDNGTTWNNWANLTSGSVRTGDYYGPVTSGTWKFKITASNGCGIGEVISSAIIVSSPAAPILFSTPPSCALNSGSISVTNSIAGSLYSLDGGAYGSSFSWTSLAANSTHTVTTQSALGCVSAATSATIGALPAPIQVAVSGNQQPCATTPTTLTASGATSYVWHNASATGAIEGTSATLTINPVVVTTYYVTGTTGSCSDTKSIVVNAPRPSLSIVNIITICKGDITQIMADNGGLANYSYSWVTPASVANNTNPVLSNQAPQITTPYKVARLSPDGCKDTATSIVNVVNQPELGIVAVADASCSAGNDGSITINATSPTNTPIEFSIDGNNWQSGNLFSNLLPGTYSVLVRNINRLCLSVSGASVTVAKIDGPAGKIVGPKTRCALDPTQFQLSPSITGATYSWTATGSPILTGGSTNSTLIAAWTKAGVYNISVIISKGGCTSTDNYPVSITAPVVVDAGPDKTICRGGATRIGTDAPAGSPTVTYSWYPIAGLSNPTAARPFASPAMTTKYTVTVTDVINQCTKADGVTVAVDVQLNPIANAGPQQTVSTTMPTAPLGSFLTSNNPWNGYAVDYLWSEVTAPDNNAIVDPQNTKMTTFMFDPTSSTRNNWTYQLMVRKFVPKDPADINSVDQYCPATSTVNIVKAGANLITLSGNVWNDVNGMTDNLVNNSGAAQVPQAQLIPLGLQVYLINNTTGLIENIAPVIPTTGMYNFASVTANTNYYLILSSLIATTGNIPPKARQQQYWINTGEKLGITTGSDNIADGRLNVPVRAANIINANFGIQFNPTFVGN